MKNKISFQLMILLLFSIGSSNLAYSWGSIARPLGKKVAKEIPDAIRGVAYGLGSNFIFEDIKLKQDPNENWVREDPNNNWIGIQAPDSTEYPESLKRKRDLYKRRHGFYPF